MKIYVVSPSGFCSGVRRAIHLVKHSFKKYNHIYCLGELIHNEIVLEDLKSQGLILLDDLEKLVTYNNSALIIRTHGISPEIYEFLNRTKLSIIDATCPIVKKIQMLCQRYSNQGYRILIFGDKNHEEVKSLIGFSYGRAVVISEEEGLDRIKLDEYTILISQSTKDEEKFFKIRNILCKNGLPESNFCNTICSDIKARQEKIRILAGRVDLVLILGSKKSANTYNLYKIAKGRCRNSYLISQLNELPEKDIRLADKIGIATGASTPYNFLNTILKEIENLSKRGEG